MSHFEGTFGYLFFLSRNWVDKVVQQPKFVFSRFWLVAWSTTLAIGWLLPNHSLPWLAFHTDAWVTLISSCTLLVLIVRIQNVIQWHRITLLAASLIGIPWIQAAVGIVPLTGVAWISTAYLLAFVLALLIGAHWERHNSNELADGLFLAVGIAAIVSVGLQLQQWLELDGLELWNMGSGSARPHANLGQPNQLATLLIWGILAAAWAWLRGYIKPTVAILMVLYLLIGVALTASRTAWIAMLLLISATWWWQRLWGNRMVPRVVTGLGVFFVITNFELAWLRFILGFDIAAQPSVLSGMSGYQRLSAWTAFADAIWQQPWLGYGWNQTVLAQIAVATKHPPIGSTFTYAHNLFLDLVVWCGIPIGLFISVCLFRWFWLRFRAVQSAENAVLVLFLLVVANHAMLELPLYYAYFLLPTGMVMGMLNVRLGARAVYSIRPWFARLLWLVATALLALIIRDYSRIEPSYQNLRFEQLRIKVAPVGPPDVLLLTQWRDYIEFARMQPKAGATSAELEHMRHVAGLFPGSLFLFNLASTLALNHQPEEARVWLEKMCRVVPQRECRDAQTIWAKQALKHPEIAAIPWVAKN